MKSWSQDRILELIALYKQRPMLWDHQHQDYKNSEKKNAAWSEIAEIMDAHDVEKKMSILIVQFRREIKRMNDRAQAGEPEDKVASKWFAFYALSFLKGKMRKLKQSNSNANEDETTNPPSKQKKRELKPSTSYINHSIENVIDYCDQSLITHNPLDEVRDEYSAFGEIVAIKLRKLSNSHFKNKAMNMITNTLFQIEMECSELENDGSETVYLNTYYDDVDG